MVRSPSAAFSFCVGIESSLALYIKEEGPRKKNVDEFETAMEPTDQAEVLTKRILLLGCTDSAVAMFTFNTTSVPPWHRGLYHHRPDKQVFFSAQCC